MEEILRDSKIFLEYLLFPVDFNFKFYADVIEDAWICQRYGMSKW